MLGGADRRIKRLCGVFLVISVLLAVLSVQAGALELTPGNHEKWIGRIADLPDYADEFYTWLVTQAKEGADRKSVV